MTFLLGGFGKTATKLIGKKFTDTHAKHIMSDDGLFCALAQGDDQLDAITINNNNGLLLGTVFTKETYESIKAFNKSIKTTDLMNNYWGRFSGVLYDASSKKVSLVRDPLGLETLYYMPLQDGILFSNKLINLVDLLEEKPEINWHYFAEFLVEQNFLIPQTPFNGITELLPGMHLQADLNGNVNQTFEWHIPTEKVTDEKAIEDMVFETFKNSTQAWAKNSKKITLQLSGGVDSSSILCMLKHVVPNTEIQAVHYNDSKTVASQEIAYAQKMADECNIPLKIMDFQESKMFEPLPADWRPEKPSTGTHGYHTAQKFINIAQNSMIFSGQGGDHVFLAPPPEESIADYWLDNGLRGISTIMHEMTSIYRTSWLVLLKTNVRALKYYLLGKRIPNQYAASDMLAQDFANQLKYESFYLAPYLKKFTPAKARQIEALYHAVAYKDDIDPIVTYPLLSLPVVEAALKIPTYLSIKDGYNRYYQRKATSRINPTQVIWRRDKGEVSASVIKGLQKELEPLIELISSGLLLKHGVIDKHWVQDRFNRIRHGDASELLPLFRIIGAELWFKQWSYN
jgi:asparagine synthase (glutamine-hydrolysing)